MALERTKMAMLNDFMTGVNDMIDASSQMASCHRLNPKWMALRDMLHLIKDDTINYIKKGGVQ